MSERAGTNPMDDLTLEEALEMHFAVEPAPVFLTALEEKLLVEQMNRARGAANRSAPAASPSPSLWQRFAGFFRPRPVVVAFVLLLLLLVPLLVIGPQRAWAGLQAWLGYVPGVGFVDLEDTRVLLAPAAETRDGVTVRVTEVIAGPEETTVVVESAGLPPEDELWGREGAQADDAFAPLLGLPDGAMLEAETFTLRVGRGTLVFPPLPADVYHATLELPVLPLVPPGAAPENWSLPLVLQPATGELVAEMYPQPYSPQGASDTHHGITLSVLEVAHTPEKTVFTVQTGWQEESWRYVHPDPAFPTLYDDMGHRYGNYVEPGSGSVATLVQRVQPGEAPPPRTAQRTFNFTPLSLAAQSLTFEVPEVEASVPATGAFTIDLGERPQVGDSWPLDVHLDVAGFPVHITRAWIDTEQLGRGEDAEERTNLYFYLEPVAPQAERRLGSLSIVSPHTAFRGSGSNGQQVLHLTLAEGVQAPGGEVEVHVDAARVAFAGPWTLSWDVPDAPALTATHLDPNQVDNANGISLRLGRVALTDRVTAVEVALEEAPAGAALQEVLPGIPGERQRRLVLEDDRLHDYWFEGGSMLWWQPDGPEPLRSPPGRSAWLRFPPVQPLARRLTMQIPTILLARPDTSAFTFTVAAPETLTFTPTPEGYGAQVSEPWPVDARFTVAGYDVHFTEARLFESGPASTSIGLTGVATATSDRPPFLHQLRVTTIAGPNGMPVHGDPPPGSGLSNLPSGIHSLARCNGRGEACEVNLSFTVTGLVQPGRYEVTLEGINELVEGPWEFSWDAPR